MSFAFAAIGTSDEVTAQLEKTPISVGEQRFNEFGAALLNVLAEHFAIEHEHVRASGGYEYRYVVKANGHGGGSVPISVQLTIEYQHVPVVTDGAQAHGAGG
jgi:hypothetical protein